MNDGVIMIDQGGSGGGPVAIELLKALGRAIHRLSKYIWEYVGENY